MGADRSRIRNNPLLDFSGVELKQGGVVLDADFNELVAVIDRRLRAVASDVLGRNTASQTTPDAFRIQVAAGTLQIGRGRLYVDGLLAENHGLVSTDPAKKAFDPLMGEVSFVDPITYGNQPYFPNPPALPTAGRHLVYLDVWNREVTHIERPDLVEVAVGVETSSRVQTVWQVRVLNPDAGSATCATPDGEVNGWAAVIAPSSGRLTTGTFDVPPSQDPCELPPTGGYRGLENQTYRVEIHDPGQPGAGATFKWSRENASVASRVASMISATELELQMLGRDEVLRFNTGDWVEIIDDVREFSQRAGEMRQITVNEAVRRITFTDALPADMIPGSFPNSQFPIERTLRVRRWDQKHEVLRTGPGGTTPVFQDLDAGTTGVINVPAPGTTLLLEHGITVTFASTGTAGFKAGDYWVFAARTADASVEDLVNEPPRGIHHHYGRLGIWDVDAGTVTDCRGDWPPVGEGHDCSCTACVTTESHSSGRFTIQDAVNQLRDTGGTVCIGVGQFQLQEPVQLTGSRSLRIKGQGSATVLVTPGGAFAITSSLAIAIEDLAILSLARSPAIAVRTVLGLSLQRLLVFVLASRDFNAPAISLTGVVFGATIRDNAILAPIGVEGPATADDRQAFLLTAALRVDRNVLWCERSAVALAGRVLHMMAARIDENDIVGCRRGAIQALGFCGPGASMRIASNQLNINGPGMSAAVDGLWIERNTLDAVIRGDAARAVNIGIQLRTGLDPNGSDQCQVLSNRISGFTGAAISIESPVRDLIVKMNQIERCGNGIVLEGASNSASVSIDNNHLSEIGGEDDASTFAAGILVTRAVAAVVSGNVVQRIGLQTLRGSLRVGIAATGVQRLQVHGNTIADIAPPGDFIGIGAGVVVLAPSADVNVTQNHISRELQPTSQGTGRTSWFALLMDQPVGERVVSRVATRAAVRLDESRTLVFGNSRPFVVAVPVITDVAGAAVVRGTSTSILGNMLEARGSTPAIQVELTGDCVFADNRCELINNLSSAAVRLAARTTILNANRIRGGELAVDLNSDPKRVTVLGNITTAPIRVAGGQLETKWEQLNVRGA